MKTLTDINAEFSEFTGSEHWYKHLFGQHYTDGVKFMAEKYQAYWLIDAIFSYIRKEEFQIWTLEVAEAQGFLSMREDTQLPFIVTQRIPFTDFPTGIFKLYFEAGILFLPSER